MEKNTGFAGSAKGYVRAVFSEKRRGYCLPVDLLRAHCRAVVCSGARERVSRAFADYLVTDPEAGYPFRDSRDKYQLRRVGVMGTGFQMPSDFGGHLDAPEWVLSGAMRWVDGVGPFPVGHIRDMV